MTAGPSRWTRALAFCVVVAATTFTLADHPAGTPVRSAAVGTPVSSSQHADPADPLVGSIPLSPNQQIRAAGASGHAVPLDGGRAASTVGLLIIDGGTHRCSASIVTSDSRRVLATAAHCVWLRGRWTLDGAYFVPGYDGGTEPWGRWAVEAAWVPRSWQQANSPIEAVASAHDVAFVRLAPNRSGQLAEDVLGSQGIWFDAPPTTTVTALGYPATGEFDGQQLEGCTGPAHAEPEPRHAGEGNGQSDGEVLILDCDMTEGSSGGPWLVGSRSAAGEGQVIGVVSGISGSDLISARYGAEAEQAYRAADTNSGLDTEDAQ